MGGDFITAEINNGTMKTTDKAILNTELEAVKEKNTDLTEVTDLQKLKEKYGTIYQIDMVVDDDDENPGRILRFIFKKPKIASFNRYLKTASKNMATSTMNFVMDNIIEEHKPILEKESEKYPGLALGIGQKLLSAIGLVDNINFKKL